MEKKNMKKTIVVPTYWGRDSKTGWQPGDLVFDHPTPLDGNDTLGRFLDSLRVLDTTDYEVALVVVPTADEIAEEALNRVKQIVSTTSSPVAPQLFTTATLNSISNVVGGGDGQFDELLSMDGYANVRNCCLLAALLTGADLAVLIDDDEIFELPDFLDKVEHGFNREFEGEEIRCLAGYYLNPDGDFRLKRQLPTWAGNWPKYQVMDEGFDRFIGAGPRYKKTPFVFGGNLTIRSDVFKLLPFDTNVTRGEDIDYLMMAMMSGIPTILDNELHIMHKAPPKSHPEWQQFRQDIIRFAYQRAKIITAARGTYEGIIEIKPEDMDPYPGFFLRDDLDERVKTTSKSLADYYSSEGDQAAAEEALANIDVLQQAVEPGFDPISEFLKMKQNWIKITEILSAEDYSSLLESF